MDPKWLNEGGAKVLEEMFVQQYYGRSSLRGDFERAKLWSDEVFTNPKLYEKFETSSKETADGWMDMNYMMMMDDEFWIMPLSNSRFRGGPHVEIYVH